MNLQSLKNTYAQEQGYPNWNELRHLRGISEVVDGYMNEICIRAQKAALEKAAENAKTTTAFASRITERIIVDRASITNPENLIR